jgi:glutamate--cysteine ligase
MAVHGCTWITCLNKLPIPARLMRPCAKGAIVNAQFEKRFAELSQRDNIALLRYIRRGIEKESLRITPAGKLAQTAHPAALGSALTHPCITTDYSEALLEFITAPDTELSNTLAELDNIHRFVYPRIDTELLWTASMPCLLEQDADIPVARYGSSNVARMKTIYRVGLGHRYGRLMQTIAGIHFNFSLDDDFWEWLHAAVHSQLSLRDFKTEQYFALIRNFHRYSWLLIYLFGASPALCETLTGDRPHTLEPLTRGTLHAPWGTSLRMGDLGYQSDAQGQIEIVYNSLDDYIEALQRAITTPHPPYVAIGTRRDGEWLQLSTSLLQIENEFYSSVRPKRVTRSGESPRHALSERGVEYVEVRCLDIDPFEPAGIGAPTARFVDAFLLYCLLRESPPSDAEGQQRARNNLQLVVNRGREPGLMLQRTQSVHQELPVWGLKMIEDIARIGDLLDQARGGSEYRASIELQKRKLEDSALTPSARVLAHLRERNQSFFRFALEQSLAHRGHFLARPLPDAEFARLAVLAGESLAAQRAIEDADDISFEEYLANYYRQ